MCWLSDKARTKEIAAVHLMPLCSLQDIIEAVMSKNWVYKTLKNMNILIIYAFYTIQ